MKYIVEVPEERFHDLVLVVGGINPNAPAPIAVGMDEDNHIMTVGKAEWWYVGQIAGGQDDFKLKGWMDLDEGQREKMAGFMSGFIGIQFDDFDLSGLGESIVQFLEENPDFLAEESGI